MYSMEWSDSRRETVEAAIASVLLHLVLILCVALALSVPAWQFPVSPPESEAPIEITMMPVEASKPEAPSYVATPGPDVAEAPKNAPFESDKNTRAASESPPSGSAAVPSLDGRESTSLELVNRDYTEGKQGVASAPRPPQAEEQGVVATDANGGRAHALIDQSNFAYDLSLAQLGQHNRLHVL